MESNIFASCVLLDIKRRTATLQELLAFFLHIWWCAPQVSVEPNEHCIVCCFLAVQSGQDKDGRFFRPWP
jgi:hypothetical protein